MHVKEIYVIFIQQRMPLPLLKSTVQSRRGVTQVMEAQVCPLVMAIPRFIQMVVPGSAPMPPVSESPHAVIEPSALRAAKAYSFE
jgi:hypothetical protein